MVFRSASELLQQNQGHRLLTHKDPRWWRLAPPALSPAGLSSRLPQITQAHPPLGPCGACSSPGTYSRFWSWLVPLLSSGVSLSFTIPDGPLLTTLPDALPPKSPSYISVVSPCLLLLVNFPQSEILDYFFFLQKGNILEDTSFISIDFNKAWLNSAHSNICQMNEGRK